MTPTEESRIAERSYHIWEREGRPEGKHLQHWFQAKAELEAGAPAPKAPSRARRSATTTRKTAAPRKRKPVVGKA